MVVRRQVSEVLPGFAWAAVLTGAVAVPVVVNRWFADPFMVPKLGALYLTTAVAVAACLGIVWTARTFGLRGTRRSR